MRVFIFAFGAFLSLCLIGRNPVGGEWTLFCIFQTCMNSFVFSLLD